MSARDAIARDENIRNLPRQRGGTPTETHDRLSAEIPDIFIPPTQHGNAGVISGRNENSGMTVGGILLRPLCGIAAKEVAPLSVLAFYLRVARQQHFPPHNHFLGPLLFVRLERVMSQGFALFRPDIAGGV